MWKDEAGRPLKQIVDGYFKEDEEEMQHLKDRYMWSVRATAIVEVLAANFFDEAERGDFCTEALLKGKNLDRWVTRLTKAVKRGKVQSG